MIAPLRTRHRLVTTLLAVVVPALFLAGLSARQTMPTNTSLPVAPPSAPPAGSTALTFGDAPVDGQFWVDDTGPQVEVAWRGGPAAPDVLVYWSAASGAADALPADARLVGALGAGALQVPSANGALVLYSLGHRSVVGRAALPGGDV